MARQNVHPSDVLPLGHRPAMTPPPAFVFGAPLLPRTESLMHANAQALSSPRPPRQSSRLQPARPDRTKRAGGGPTQQDGRTRLETGWPWLGTRQTHADACPACLCTKAGPSAARGTPREPNRVSIHPAVPVRALGPGAQGASVRGMPRTHPLLDAPAESPRPSDPSCESDGHRRAHVGSAVPVVALSPAAPFGSKRRRRPPWTVSRTHAKEGAGRTRNGKTPTGWCSETRRLPTWPAQTAQRTPLRRRSRRHCRTVRLIRVPTRSVPAPGQLPCVLQRAGCKPHALIRSATAPGTRTTPLGHRPQRVDGHRRQLGRRLEGLGKVPGGGTEPGSEVGRGQ